MTTKEKWFAMGAPYRNELKVQKALGDRGIECFVPMVTRVVEDKGRKKKQTEPAISNLIFVHTTEERLIQVKPFIPRLQYKVYQEAGTVKKVVVRDSEMENFIAFLKGCKDISLRFLTPEEIDFKAGTKVRVIGGTFNGVEGILAKISGRRKKVLSVNLTGLISATVEISPDLIEIIP